MFQTQNRARHVRVFILLAGFFIGLGACRDLNPPGAGESLQHACNVSSECPSGTSCCLGVCSERCACGNGRLDPREVCEFDMAIENGGCWECERIVCDEGFELFNGQSCTAIEEPESSSSSSSSSGHGGSGGCNLDGICSAEDGEDTNTCPADCDVPPTGNGSSSSSSGGSTLSCSDPLKTLSDNGECVCITGHSGFNCDLCAEGYQDKDGNGLCRKSCASAGLSCGANAACSDTFGQAECACTLPYADGDQNMANGCEALSWLNTATATSAIYGDIEALDVATFMDGSSIVVGSFSTRIETQVAGEARLYQAPGLHNRDGFAAGVDAHGNLSWLRQISSVGHDKAAAVHMASPTRALVVGTFCEGCVAGDSLDKPALADVSFATQGGSDIFVFEVDVYGNVHELKTLGSMGNDLGMGVTPLADAGMALSGVLGGELSIDDQLFSLGESSSSAFVARFAADRTLQWLRTVHADQVQGVEASLLSADMNMDIYLGGDFLGALDLGDHHILSAQGNKADGFIAKLRANDGKTMWGIRVGTDNRDSLTDMVTIADGSMEEGISFVSGFSKSGSTPLSITQTSTNCLSVEPRTHEFPGEDGLLLKITRYGCAEFFSAPFNVQSSGNQRGQGVSLLQESDGSRRVLLSFADDDYPALAEYSFAGEYFGSQQAAGFATPQALANVGEVLINVGRTSANHVDFGDAGVYSSNTEDSVLWIWRSLACLGQGCAND